MASGSGSGSTGFSGSRSPRDAKNRSRLSSGNKFTPAGILSCSHSGKILTAGPPRAISAVLHDVEVSRMRSRLREIPER